MTVIVKRWKRPVHLEIGDSDTRVGGDGDEVEKVDNSDDNEESRYNQEEEQDVREISGHHITRGRPRHFSGLPAIFETFIVFLGFQCGKFHI